MAFGFKREAGGARGYVNVDNPLFASGMRLSRRQYDKMVSAMGERRPVPSEAPRRERQGAGQRRFNLALDLYVRHQREAGRTINKVQARKEAAFKAALADIKTDISRSGNRNDPNAILAAKRRRARGFRVLEGDTGHEFGEQYERRFGNIRRAAA